jgi:selenocysteine lyase/cysteine desulfurase
MMDRKTFIKNSSLALGLTLPYPILSWANMDMKDIQQELALHNPDSESYWTYVSSLFEKQTKFINLENGYFSPQPLSTLAYHTAKEAEINKKTSWFMRKEQEQEIENARLQLASFLGQSPEEIAMTRNTTESLNTVISGYPWKKGDEVIIGNQDYGSMVAAFQQQVKRSGIVLKVAQIPLQPKNDEEVIEAYMSLVNAKTKVIHLTHLINLTGQIIPAEKIIDLAHQKQIEVMVDAAHSVAHVSMGNLVHKADYFAASLHKWLCCPIGVGVLKINLTHIEKIFPLMADSDMPVSNIRKFEHQGTRPIHSLQTIASAIHFHQAIGAESKEKRLKLLKANWYFKLDPSSSKLQLNTPFDESRSGAIANFGVNGMEPEALADLLFERYSIYTVAINHPHVKGVRITPHLYNSLKEIDALNSAIDELVK